MTTELKNLGTRAVKAFPHLFKDAWKHDFKYDCFHGFSCLKCGNGRDDKHPTCTVPDPIDINDWNVAYKLARSVDAELFRVALVEIWYDQTAGGDFTKWLLVAAQPSDYILAAIKAAEGERV